MRHRKAVGNDALAWHVDHYATIASPIAPAVDDVAAADRGGETRSAFVQGKPVEVAAVFGHELTDERRTPEWRETVALVQCREAIEAGVDEDRAAVGVDRNVVRVQVADGVPGPRHVEPVVPVVGIAVRQDVLESPQLVMSPQPHALAVGP